MIYTRRRLRVKRDFGLFLFHEHREQFAKVFFEGFLGFEAVQVTEDFFLPETYAP